MGSMKRYWKCNYQNPIWVFGDNLSTNYSNPISLNPYGAFAEFSI